MRSIVNKQEFMSPSIACAGHAMANSELQQRIERMKHLSSGVAIAAVLVFAASAWAQAPNPSGGNPMGMPGPNPGGPSLTPYSTGTSPSMAMPSSTSATPPKHRHARSSKHHGKMARSHRGPQLTGSSASQLNQEELARLQAGNFGNPAAPPAPAGPESAASAEVRGRGFGPKASGSGYIPPPPPR
jgi:hypothetical protein